MVFRCRPDRNPEKFLYDIARQEDDPVNYNGFGRQSDGSKLDGSTAKHLN